MDTVIAPLPQDVAREARRLDRLFPNWATKINEETLDLPSHGNCILGQVTGNFAIGWPVVQADQLEEFGGTWESAAYIWPRYEQFWLDEVARRLN